MASLFAKHIKRVCIASSKESLMEEKSHVMNLGSEFLYVFFRFAVHLRPKLEPFPNHVPREVILAFHEISYFIERKRVHIFGHSFLSGEVSISTSTYFRWVSNCWRSSLIRCCVSDKIERKILPTLP